MKNDDWTTIILIFIAVALVSGGFGYSMGRMDGEVAYNEVVALAYCERVGYTELVAYKFSKDEWFISCKGLQRDIGFHKFEPLNYEEIKRESG